jgi:hypothetical protein
MPNSPKLEKIFEAWWELEHCLPAKRAEFESELNRLVDDIVSQSDQRLNREQILDHLFSPYKEYRGQRRKNAQIQIAQTAVKK